MQAAFIDIGLERTAFLHASDIYQENTINEISELLHEGQEIIVQVVKDPLGTKGARLTTNVSIPSRYLVFMPKLETIGVSQKIESEGERERLREILKKCSEESEYKTGFIARTAADGASKEELIRDIQFLERLWQSICDRSQSANIKQSIHEELPLALRALRDLINSEVEKVRIDSKSTYEKAVRFIQKFIPDNKSIIEYYPGERPLFDLFSVENEIKKALKRNVDLKSGGHLIIDQTEAMTTIDVNTGAYVGYRNLEETIFKTNLEASQAICRQLRMRNLGGIIIIDFIDMNDLDHQRQVIRALERYLSKDHAKTHVTGVSSIGLVEMTRKRTRESLGHILCEPCPICNGRGALKTAETTCYEIFREILRESRQFDVKQLLILASPEVIEKLLDEESQSLAELEEFIGKPIKLQPESLYNQEQYDVVLV